MPERKKAQVLYHPPLLVKHVPSLLPLSNVRAKAFNIQHYNQNGLTTSFDCTDSSCYEMVVAKDFSHLLPRGHLC